MKGCAQAAPQGQDAAQQLQSVLAQAALLQQLQAHQSAHSQLMQLLQLNQLVQASSGSADAAGAAFPFGPSGCAIVGIYRAKMINMRLDGTHINITSLTLVEF